MTVEIRDPYLSPRGWPRPWTADQNGVRRPQAWVTVAPNFASMDTDRRAEMTAGLLCQVCGIDHEEGAEVVIFHVGGPRRLDTGEPIPMSEGEAFIAAAKAGGIGVECRDGGILHERCARLAARHCPALRRYATTGLLGGFVAPLGAVVVITDGDEDDDGDAIDLVLVDASRVKPWP